jgi:hypothetical protein
MSTHLLVRQCSILPGDSTVGPDSNLLVFFWLHKRRLQMMLCGCIRWRLTVVVALQVLIFEGVTCFMLRCDSRATAMLQRRSRPSSRHIRMLDSTGVTRKAAAVPTPSQAGSQSSIETRLHCYTAICTYHKQHIINCTSGPCFYKDDPKSGFTYLNLPMHDGVEEDITRSFDPSFAVIEAARRSGGCCLVHCSKGD